MDNSIGSAYLRILPDTSGLNARLGAYFSGSQFSKLGKAAGVALGAGLVAGGAVKGLYEIGQAYDEAFDKIRVGTGATGKHLKRLEGDFKNVVGSVPADFDSASTAVADLNTRLGLTGKPLRAVSKQMLELSRITDTDVGQNIQSVTRLFGDWSVKTGEQAETLDKLYRASQATGIEVSDLSDLMVQFGSPLRQLGLDFDTAAAMFSRFEKEGVNIQTLMPGLRYALKNFSAPTDDLSKQLDKLGISLKDGPAAALQEVFAALEKAPSDLKANALAFQVFGARAGPDMAAAVREGRFELDDLMKTIENGRDTVRKAGRDTMDFGEQWTLLKNNLTNALEPLASKVFKALGDEMARVRRILTDKKLSADEKFSAIMDEIGRLAEKYGPKIAEAGGKLGVALAKGIANAFWNSSLLGELFIGAAALRIFGGPGVFSKLGALMARTIAPGLGSTLPSTVPVKGQGWGALGTRAGALLGPALAVAIAVELGRHKDEILDALPLPEDAKSGFRRDSILPGGSGDDNIFEQAAKAWKGLTGQTDDAAKSVVRYKDALKDAKPTLKSNQQNLDMLGDRLGYLTGDTKKTGRVWGDVWGKAKKDVDGSAKSTNRDLSDVRDSLDKTKDKGKNYADAQGGFFARVTKASAKQAKGVSGNNASMVNAVGSGLGVLKANVQAALKDFGVKKGVSYAIKKVGKSIGNIIGAQKGAIVPGLPGESGDKHLLSLDGVPIAAVEKDEQISVLNRTATSAMMAINRRIPRRARGGMVDPAGPGTGVVNAAIADVVGAWSKKYDAAINYGYDPGGGHLSPGHNVTGTATDTGPAAGWGEGPTSLFEKGLRLLVSNGLTVLYGSHGIGTPYDNHGYGNHAHIEWGMHPEIRGLAAAAVETIKRIILDGPKGRLRDMGQAALDRTRKAANAFIRENSGGMMGGDIGAPIRSLPDTLQKYNRTYPRSSGFGDGYALPFNVVAAIAEWAGSPGVSMARTAIGESQLEPGAVGHDPGGSTGWGLQMITTGVGNDAMINSYGGGPQMLNPIKNEQAAAEILKSSGWGAWYSSTKDTSNTHYSGPLLRRMFGGLVPGLKDGAKLKGDGRGSVTDTGPTGAVDSTNTLPLIKAKKLRDKIVKLLGDRGVIARLEDQIAIAEWTAGLAGSENGTELGAGEIRGQVDLQKRLLNRLMQVRDLSRAGLRLTRRGGGKLGKMGETFASYLLDMAGASGKTGRIWETQKAIAELLGTTASTSAGLDIGGLRSVIEAARYGAFDRELPAFHTGGVYRAPVGRNEGPALLRDGETVIPAGTPPVTVENSIDSDGVNLWIETTVNGVIEKRERIDRRKGRQLIRT